MHICSNTTDMTIEAVQDMRALMDAIEQGLKDNAEYIKKHGNPSIYEGEVVSGSEAFPTYELWKFPKDIKVQSEKLIVTQNLEDIKKYLRSQTVSISHTFKVAKNGSYMDLPEFGINSQFATPPTNEKAKLLQKINEIHSAKPYDNMDDNGLINFRYDDALGGDEKLASIPGISRNEVYDNGVSRHIFLMNNKEPIFLLTIKRGLDGWVTTNVVTHSDYRGKGFAVPVYLAVSKAYGEPLYSFGTQSPAGHKIWQNLAKQHPKRVTGYDVTTKQEVPFADVFDGKVATRAKLLPENFKDGKVKGKSRPGRVKKAGASCKGSVTSLRKKAKNSSGEKAKMYHWCANMKAGKKRSIREVLD